jgi:hypothetical protein
VLVQNSGHLVDKDELLRLIWPDTFVEEGSLTKNVFVLRKILEEGQAGKEYIETIPKRGYRFVAPVTEVREPIVRPQGRGACPVRDLSAGKDGRGESIAGLAAEPVVGGQALSCQASAPLGLDGRLAGRSADWRWLLAGQTSRHRFLTPRRPK